ncbi:hypothetical protein BC629DRAFT_1442011 [Irpex lacteus]|nr:hypothetical protein BC629DRAFT_1442011 [Irpex lacteus]
MSWSRKDTDSAPSTLLYQLTVAYTIVGRLENSRVRGLSKDTADGSGHVKLQVEDVEDCFERLYSHEFRGWISCGGGLGFTAVVIIMIGRRELENAEQNVVAHTHAFGLAMHFDGPHSSKGLLTTTFELEALGFPLPRSL